MEKATKRKSPVRTKHVFDSLKDSLIWIFEQSQSLNVHFNLYGRSFASCWTFVGTKTKARFLSYL